MYVILEVQKTANDVATLVNKADNLNQAESVYHQILTYAAISSIPQHSAILMTDAAVPLMYHCYVHETVPEVEPVVE